MKVRELREALSDFPDEAEVYYDGDSSGEFDTFVLLRSVFDDMQAVLLTKDGRMGGMMTLESGSN